MGLASVFRAEVDEIAHGVALLRNEQLSIPLISIGVMESIFRKARNTAANFHASLPFAQAAHLLRLPATFTFNQDNLRVAFAIPLTTGRMSLERFIKAPIVVHTPQGFQLMELRPESAYIATETRGTDYALLSTEDLEGCINIGLEFMCPEVTLRTDVQDTCLSALYSSNGASVLDKCPLQPTPEELSITPKKDGSFVFATTVQQPARVRCNGVLRHTYQLDPGQHIITAPPGCTISGNTASVTRAKQHVATITVERNLTFAGAIAEDILHGHSLADITKISTRTASLARRIDSTLQLVRKAERESKSAMEIIQESIRPHHINLGLIVVIVIIFLAVAAAACFKYGNVRTTVNRLVDSFVDSATIPPAAPAPAAPAAPANDYHAAYSAAATRSALRRSFYGKSSGPGDTPPAYFAASLFSQGAAALPPAASPQQGHPQHPPPADKPPAPTNIP